MAWGALVVGLGMQGIPVDRTNPPVRVEADAPEEVAAILRRACYDCHSNETHWPWYSRVAPVSWLLASHVKRGRADLNLSEWPVVDFEAQALHLADIHEQVSKQRMPPRSYALLHRAARLDSTALATLMEWAQRQ